MHEPSKRLELRLPVSHPVWSLPDGSRATIVREWLEIGRRLDQIQNGLDELKASINSSVKPAETVVHNDVSVPNVQQGEFDKNTFLSHFK